MNHALAIGLSSWIIRDGNYPDFTCGHHAAFALEFYAPNGLAVFEPSTTTKSGLTYLGGARYTAMGRVAYLADDWWVIDVGYRAFRNEKPPSDMQLDTWVKGEIYIGVDPFFYFETLAHRAGAPTLIHDWHVKRIEMETGPWIEVEVPADSHSFLRGRRILQRDHTKLEYREIRETDAWKDDDDRGAYILHCRRLQGVPRRTRK